MFRRNNYTSTDKAAESSEKAVTRKASSTDIAKALKKQRVKGAGKGAAEGAAAVNDDRPVLEKKPVTGAHEKKLLEMRERNTKMVENLKTHLSNCESLTNESNKVVKNCGDISLSAGRIYNSHRYCD